MRIDFDKYSLIRFILPMIVGMGGANLCIDAIPITAIYLLPVLLLALVFMVVFLKSYLLNYGLIFKPKKSL